MNETEFQVLSLRFLSLEPALSARQPLLFGEFNQVEKERGAVWRVAKMAGILNMCTYANCGPSWADARTLMFRCDGELLVALRPTAREIAGLCWPTVSVEDDLATQRGGCMFVLEFGNTLRVDSYRVSLFGKVIVTQCHTIVDHNISHSNWLQFTICQLKKACLIRNAQTSFAATFVK